MLDGGGAAKASSPACFWNGAPTMLKMRSRVAISFRSSTARMAVSATQLRKTYLGLIRSSPLGSSPSTRAITPQPRFGLGIAVPEKRQPGRVVTAEIAERQRVIGAGSRHQGQQAA